MIEVGALKRLLEIDRTFENRLMRFIQVLATQVAYTAMANAAEKVDVRLARWLLMCHDRVDGNELHLTHGYISLMLAVRRASITTALHLWKGNIL